MLRQGVKRISRSAIGLSARSSSSKPTWSTGEVTHPAPLDCPDGNKGQYPQKLPDGGVQYFGFKYYPRFHDEVDPPYDPAPLHLVTKIKSLSGRPYWEKDIMRTIGLYERSSGVAVMKNNPENNSMLWKVKHLVKITPLRIPKDLPDDVDPRSCFLKENGEFIYSPHLHVSEAALKEDENIAKTKWPKKFIDDHTRKNWEYPWQIKLC